MGVLVRVFQRNRISRRDREREREEIERESEVLFWELLAYTFMEAGKSHDLMSASS